MQQLSFDVSVANLVSPPYPRHFVRAESIDGCSPLPLWDGAELLIIPNISCYIGSDTIACISSSGMHQSEKPALLIDIGANDALVLRNKKRLVAGRFPEKADLSTEAYGLFVSDICQNIGIPCRHEERTTLIPPVSYFN